VCPWRNVACVMGGIVRHGLESKDSKVLTLLMTYFCCRHHVSHAALQLCAKSCLVPTQQHQQKGLWQPAAAAGWHTRSTR
jgi:hypothetical protein